MSWKMNAEHRRVLGILAGCPDGATAYCLTHLNGASLATLNELVQHELADARFQAVRARSGNGSPIVVVRLKITSTGRGAINVNS